MKKISTSMPIFFLTLLCGVTLHTPAVEAMPLTPTGVCEAVLDPYTKTSTNEKYVIALLAAITVNRWYVNQAEHSNCCHEIGRIQYELKELLRNKVQRTLLSDEEIVKRRQQLEEELLQQKQLMTGAGRRRWLWGIPALILTSMVLRSMSGWYSTYKKKAQAAKEAKEAAEKSKAKRVAAEAVLKAKKAAEDAQKAKKAKNALLIEFIPDPTTDA
ncbi:MAG: hypothetical protein PVJ92_02495 [Candidatus Dependentiae bacterium]|jgi:hypothetical protein